jgi:murein DD-endopeptidase MepM/ murein hydrolase activator NlpD
MVRTRSVVDRPGRVGIRRLVDSIVTRNGQVVSVQTVEEQILRRPTTQLLRIGTQRTHNDKLGDWLLSGQKALLTSGFGRRWGRFHSGVDWGVPIGTAVRAFARGTVRFAGAKSLYGNLVILEHADGLTTFYAHNSRILVAPGQRVETGDTIALSGNTGLSTGPHLHFEVHENGRLVDPLEFLKRTKRN